MLAFIVTTILCFITYLLFTTGSATEYGPGFLGYWSWIEIAFGALLSIVIGFIARKIFVKDSFRMLNPVRWFTFLAYLIGPFFVALAKANVDVAYRVITNKIKPGIVRISPELKTDLGDKC